MRLEDKELEGPALERESHLEELVEQNDEHDRELPELEHDELVDLELSHRSRLFDALQLILDNEPLDVALLYLPLRETQALEALQTAVTGRDTMNMFVFAEDRAALLEQALAVLQQNLTHGSPAELAELQTKFDSLTDRVADLRGRLLDLEDAQDELLEGDKHAPKAVAGETADASESVTGFIASALQALAVVAGTDVESLRSTLDGPERPEAPKAPSTLDGPERVPFAKPATSLAGPALPDAPPAATTLEGPDAPARPDFETTLDGPERPAEPRRSRLQTIEPPSRKSSPTIEPPRNKFPSVAPPMRTGRATTPPGGVPPLARPSGELDMPPLPVSDAAIDPSTVRITTAEPPAEPAPPPAVGKPTRRGLSVRSTDKPKDKK